MKYGFEVEYFVKRDHEYTTVDPAIPHDECGYLAEARGEPSTKPIEAAYLLEAAIYRMGKSVYSYGMEYGLWDGATIQLPLKVLHRALRRFGKVPATNLRGNMYLKEYPEDDTLQRAGLHVHFSNEIKAHVNGQSIQYNGFIDMVKIISTLDKAFEKEIKASQRLPGMYELKSYGFEYRSLPATANPVLVANELEKWGFR